MRTARSSPSFHPRACVFAAMAAMLLLTGCGRTAPGPREITVFAAASLTDALEALADSFEAAHPGTRVILNVAASSLLARQIEEGAPADVFFSASVDWMAQVEQSGRIEGRVLYPLGNRLVVAVPAGTHSLENVSALADLEHIALAEPSSVPAGIYAKAALTCLGIWDRIEPLVVPTQDVRTTLLTISNRAVDAAVVYASDLLADPGVRMAAAIPDSCQPDIRYAAARVTAGRNPSDADTFLAYVTAPERAWVWERYGFRYVPPESAGAVDNPAP